MELRPIFFISNQWLVNIKVISIILLLVLLHSCIYETNELSNVNVSRPLPNHPMTLTLSAETDSIVVFGETAFKYDVNTFGLNFTALEVKFRGMTYNLEKSSGIITVTPDFENTAEWQDLTINFYASTGSGSIADKYKAENYIGSKTWKIKYLDVNKHDFSLHQKITSDSILEIYYVNPHNIDTIFGNLTKIFDVNMKVTHQSGDTLFFADSTFYGGMQTYELKVTKYVSFTHYYDTTVNYSEIPILTVSDINQDSCLVSWTSIHFKIDYMVTDSYIHTGPKIYYTGSGQSFKDTQPKPNWGKFYFLYTRSRYNKSNSGWGLAMDVYWKDHSIF